MPFWLKMEAWFSRFSTWVGYFSAILLLLLLANVFYDVIMRYWFNDVSIGMQEAEWHLYAMVFLFGIAYALDRDGHVRVDVIYERLSPRRKAWIDILGILFFLWPFCYLVASYGIGFAYEAYDINEMSGDPGGLPHRWVIKGMVSVSFICVLLSSLGFLLRAVNVLLGNRPDYHHHNVSL